MINDLYYSDVYNTLNKFNAHTYKKLVRYKSILEIRIFNSTYAGHFSNEDIISQITILLSK